MANQGKGGGQVVIRLDARLFYALLAGVAFVVALGLVFYIGLKLGQRGQQTAAVSQPVTSFQQPGLQPAQPGGAVQLQPGQGQQPPFDQPAVRQARLPAGDEVPIGDNPRLALPELAKTNYVHDFGKVPPDEIQEATIKVVNKGTKPLEIKSVRASCGCTAANTGEDVIPPGESTNLRVTYDPTYDNDAGKQITRQVIIESNDPAAPVVEFTIRADVQTQ
ncbi:MAG: DUF1573 domain-containing protein [Chloroflexi bacterium]|nr:MAG: DUF1573 domain-containing protein [Chloroflexota bacterium]